MPFVPVPNVALVEIRMLAMAQLVENTLWFEFGSAPDAADLTALLEAVESWWVSEVKPLTSSRVGVREFVATDMSSQTGPVASLAGTILDVGSNTPNAMPLGTTLTVSFRTALRGRSFRGRNYIVGLTEDQVDGNAVEAGVATSWSDAYSQLPVPTLAAGWTWGVVSRFSGIDPATGDPIPRAEGIFTPITAVVVVDDFIDSQRRRLSGRGQ